MAGDMPIIDLMEAGIRAESVRQQTIASNIANLNSPGYRRVDIRFEEVLAKAIEKNGDVSAAKLEPEVFQPNKTRVKTNGNDVSLDMEVGEMLKNSLRHRTFMALLKKKYQQMHEAIRA